MRAFPFAHLERARSDRHHRLGYDEEQRAQTRIAKAFDVPGILRQRDRDARRALVGAEVVGRAVEAGRGELGLGQDRRCFFIAPHEDALAAEGERERRRGQRIGKNVGRIEAGGRVHRARDRRCVRIPRPLSQDRYLYLGW